MAYADWTDREWKAVISEARMFGVIPPLTEGEVRKAAFAYMQHGADGGGNTLGLTGTLIASIVDKVNRGAIKT